MESKRKLSVSFPQDTYFLGLDSSEQILSKLGRKKISFIYEDIGKYTYERYFFQQPILDLPFRSNFNCSPPTPVEELNSYNNEATRHGNKINNIIRNLNLYSLHMAEFALALNDYRDFLRSLPEEFCIGPSNRAEYDSMDMSIRNTITIINTGINKFEDNFGNLINNYVPLLEDLTRNSNNIDQRSRDFRPVINTINRIDRVMSNYDEIEIWGLSDQIIAFSNLLDEKLSLANSSLERAIDQIQTNVETESNRFVQSLGSAKQAYEHWNNVDGLVGVTRFIEVFKKVNEELIPEFNAFLEKVIDTPRIREAVSNAQDAINEIGTMANSFPTFQPLPNPSSNFPYIWDSSTNASRKFGTNETIEMVQNACIQYYNKYSKKLVVDALSYEHGGKIPPHDSHTTGNDADVDPVEVGNYGQSNYKYDLALEAAKLFLSTNAKLIFHADQNVVENANSWAQANNIPGRLQVEAKHTNHFHLRWRHP